MPVKAILRLHSAPIPLIGTSCREPENVSEDVVRRSPHALLVGYSPSLQRGEQVAAPGEINHVTQDPAILSWVGTERGQTQGRRVWRESGEVTRDTQVFMGEKQSR